MKKIFLIAAFILGLTLSAQNPTPFDNSIRVKNLATQSGTPDIAVFDSNKVLKKIAWASLPSGLPSQTGHSGKYLTTNGTTASWTTISGGSSNDLNETTLLGNFTEQNIQFQGGAAIDFFNIHHGYLNGIGLTANRSWDMPDRSGIVALEDDLLDFVPYSGATSDVDLGSNFLSTQKAIIGGWEPMYIGSPSSIDRVGLFRENDDKPIASYDVDGYWYAEGKLKYDFSSDAVRVDGFFNMTKGTSDEGVEDFTRLQVTPYDLQFTGISGTDNEGIGRISISANPYGFASINKSIDNTLETSIDQNQTSITNSIINNGTSESTTVEQTANSFTYNGVQIATIDDITGGTTPTFQDVTDEDNLVTLGNEGMLFEFKNSDNPSGSLSIYNADNDGGGAAHLAIAQGSNYGLLTANNLFFGDVSTSFGVQSIYRAGSIANGGISYNLPNGASSALATEAYVDSVAGGGDALTSNPLSQFASTTSSQLAGVVSNETGTGFVVFSDSPTLSGTPNAPTQSANDNTTKIATTAYADAKVQNSLSASTTVAPSATAVNTALDNTMKIITDTTGGSVINVSNTETLIYSLPVPANTLANGSWANVDFNLERLAGGATLNLRIYASTSAATLGSQFALFSTTATNRLTLNFERQFKIVSNTLDPNKWPVGTGALSNNGVVAPGGTPTTVAFNPAVDMWIHVTAIHTTTPANIQTFGSTLKFKK
jgi:hypothetical protein